MSLPSPRTTSLECTSQCKSCKDINIWQKSKARVVGNVALGLRLSLKCHIGKQTGQSECWEKHLSSSSQKSNVSEVKESASQPPKTISQWFNPPIESINFSWQNHYCCIWALLKLHMPSLISFFYIYFAVRFNVNYPVSTTFHHSLAFRESQVKMVILFC